MDDDMYKLRNDVDKVKDKISNYDDLTKAVNTLNRIFEDASQDLKLDTHDAVLVAEKLDKIMARLEKVEVQNEKIAKGIVALADMIEDTNRSRQTAMMGNRPTPGIPPSPNPPGNAGVRPLPTYNLPKQEEKKRNFLNF